eukprot:3771098-Prymnesium_polylepis.2
MRWTGVIRVSTTPSNLGRGGGGVGRCLFGQQNAGLESAVRLARRCLRHAAFRSPAGHDVNLAIEEEEQVACRLTLLVDGRARFV